MKKTRLLSLLLAVIMTVSCLPMVATTVSAAETNKVQAGVELLKNDYLSTGNWSGLGVTSKHDAAHLRWYASLSGMISVADLNVAKYQKDVNGVDNFTLSTGVTYTVKVLTRPQAISNTHYYRIMINGSNAGEGGVAGSDNIGSISKTFTVNAASGTVKLGIRGAGAHQAVVPKEVYGVEIYNGSTLVYKSNFNDSGLGNINSWKDNGATFVPSRDYIRVSAIALKNNSPAETDYNASASFAQNVVLTPGTYELSFDSRMSYFFNESAHNSAELEYEYQKQLAAAGASATRTGVKPVKGQREYDIENDVALKATYTLLDGKRAEVTKGTTTAALSHDVSTEKGNFDDSYTVRMSVDGTGLSTKLYHILYVREYGYRSWMNNQLGVDPKVGFDSLKCFVHENDRDVKVSLKNGNNVIKEAVINVNNVWANKKVTFTVNQNTNLSSISFGGTGKAYDNDAFDVSNLSLKMVEPKYTVTNDPIESGVLVNATKNYTGVVNKVVDYSDVTTVPGDYAQNGYVTVDLRPWRWSDGDNGFVPNANSMINVKLSEKASADYVYYVSFDVRHSVPTNDKQVVRADFFGTAMKGANGQDGNQVFLKDASTDWNTFTYSVKGSDVSGKEITLWVRKSAWYVLDIPVDLDNVIIWKEAVGGNGKYDAGEELFLENFNSRNSSSIFGANNSYGKIYNQESVAMHHNFEDTYARNASIAYTNVNGDNAVYTFSADVRVPYFWAIDMRALSKSEGWTKADNESATYLGYNKHSATISFTMEPVDASSPAKAPVTVTKEIGYLWSNISTDLIVEDGYKLTGVTVTPNLSVKVPDANKAIEFKNVSLVRHGGFVDKNTAIENEDGLLANATKSYTDANIVECEYDFNDYTTDNGIAAVNGYIAIDRLPWYFRTESATSNGKTSTAGWASNTIYFTMTLDEKIAANTAYGVKIDARRSTPSAESTQMKFRLLNGGGTIDIGPNGNTGVYFVAGNDFTTFATSYTPAAGSAIGKNFVVSIRRGPGPMNAPVDFDNLTVWVDSDKDCVQDANERVIYSENFNDADGGYIGTANNKLNTKLDRAMDLGTAKISHRFEETYAKVSGADCAVAYTNLDLNPGVYTFSAKLQVPYHYYTDIRNEGDWGPAGRVWAKGDGNGEALYAANEHAVNVKFTLTPDDANADVVYKTVETTVTNAWDDVSAAVLVDEGYTLTAVTVTPTFNAIAKTAWGANNVALNFKNVDLVCNGGYVPFTGAIESGDFLTGADSDYTEVDTVYDLDSDNFDNGNAVKNGYITTGRQPWYYSGSNWKANTIAAFKQNGEITYTQGNQYGITFSARKSVPSNETVKVRAYFYGSNTGTPEMVLTEEWKEYSAVWTAGNITGQHLNASINIIGGNADTSIDIDNLTYWEDTNRNGVYDEGETIVYSKNYNDANTVYIGGAADPRYLGTKFDGNKDNGLMAASNSIGAANISGIAYSNFKHLFEDNYAVGDLAYTDIKDAADGVYTFTADIKLPYHYHYDMTQIKSSDKATAQEYFDLNNHDVKVTFTLSDGTDEIERAVTLKNAATAEWGTIAASVVVNEGYVLTGVKAEYVSKLVPGTDTAIVPADTELYFRNAYLTSSELPIVEAEEEDGENYLDGLKPQYNDNTIPREVKFEKPDGELYISERTTADAYNNYMIFKLTTGVSLVANRTYYVDYNITAAANCRIRVTVNSNGVSEKVEDAAGNKFDSPANFLIANENSDLKTVYYDNKAGTVWLHSDLAGGVSYNFKSHFTPTADNKNLVIDFNRGDYGPNSKAALTIDDISIYYLDGNNEKVYVYTNDFNTAGALAGFTGNSYVDTAFYMEHILPVSHTEYSPIDDTKPMSVTYVLGLTKDEAVEGKYSFRAIAKLAERTDKDCKVRVSFNYADGTTEFQYLDLSTSWGVIGKQGWLGRGPILESITIEMNADVPVMLIKPDLDIFYKYTYGKPNTGIVMVLIKKMQGKMVDPWKQVGVN